MSGGGSSHCRHLGTALSAPTGCGYNANPKIPAEEAGRGRKLHRRVHHVLRWAVGDRRWLWAAPKSFSGSVRSAAVVAAGREALQMDGTAVDFDRDSARVRGAILAGFRQRTETLAVSCSILATAVLPRPCALRWLLAFWRMGAIKSCLHLATSRLAKPNGKAALARTPKPTFPSGKSAGSGLLGFHLLVVMVVMMALMLLVVLVVMMMMVVMLLRHRSCVRAAGADDRQRDSKGESQPESRQEGLLHDFVSFSARAEFDRHRARSVT